MDSYKERQVLGRQKRCQERGSMGQAGQGARKVRRSQSGEEPREEGSRHSSCVADSSAVGKRLALSGMEGRPVGLECDQDWADRHWGLGTGADNSAAKTMEVFSPGTMRSCEAQVDISVTLFHVIL